jgi:hypothetical protein
LQVDRTPGDGPQGHAFFGADVVHHIGHPFAAVVVGFDEERTLLREGKRERQVLLKP